MSDLIDPTMLVVEVIYLQTGTTEMPGGQHAGTPASSIRVTHIPSGVMAQCGACRSQHKNKTIAIGMIEAALTGKFANELF
jgi:protein subunit release factor A